MAARYRLRITVTKRLSSKDIYGKALSDVSEEKAGYCDSLKEGQVFTVDESGSIPAGFCTWAWHDIYPVVIALRYGANFPWIKKEGLMYSSCSDGAQPVFFKIERV